MDPAAQNLETKKRRRPTVKGTCFVGISGARRNPAAAVAVDGRLRGFCEQERLTRIRGAGLRPGELPTEAVQAVLELAGVAPDAVRAYVTAEEGVTIPAGLVSLRLDHHHCHAATAFLTSPFEDAAVLVCDRNSAPEMSVWTGHGADLVNQQWPWRGQSFASLFTEGAQLFGFAAGQEHRLEALARLDSGGEWERFTKLFHYADGTLHVDAGWKRAVSDWLHSNGPRWSFEHGARVA